MIKNIIFDVGNVLVDFHPVDYMRRKGFPEDVIEIFDEKIIKSELWNDVDLSVKPKEEIMANLKKQVPGYELYVDIFFIVIKDICYVYDYTSDWIKSFKDKGYNTYILSNYPEDLWYIHEREIFDFLKYTDGKVVSGQIKMIKPDPNIYKYILDKYCLNPEECIFIDDRADNVMAANEMGINAIQFTNKEDVDRILASVYNIK